MARMKKWTSAPGGGDDGRSLRAGHGHPRHTRAVCLRGISAPRGGGAKGRPARLPAPATIRPRPGTTWEPSPNRGPDARGQSPTLPLHGPGPSGRLALAPPGRCSRARDGTCSGQHAALPLDPLPSPSSDLLWQDYQVQEPPSNHLQDPQRPGEYSYSCAIPFKQDACGDQLRTQLRQLWKLLSNPCPPPLIFGLKLLNTGVPFLPTKEVVGFVSCLNQIGLRWHRGLVYRIQASTQRQVMLHYPKEVAVVNRKCLIEPARSHQTFSSRSTTRSAERLSAGPEPSIHSSLRPRN